MQLEALKVFCDVVRTASFSRGAAENQMSQSSASQAVHNLEERLGVKLIDRSKRPLVPTVQGRLFFEGCRELLDRYEELVHRVQGNDPRESVQGVVRLSAIYSVGLSHLTQHIDRFRARFPEADCRLECTHPDRVLESVREGGADLGVISFPKKWADLVVTPWRDEEMVVILSPQHPLTRCTQLEPLHLEGQKFVHFDANLGIRRAIDRFLKASGTHVETVLTFDNIENIKRAVEVGAGISVLPLPSVLREQAAGTLEYRRFVGSPLVRPLAIIHRGATPLSRATARFFEALRQEPVGKDEAAALGLNKPADPREGRDSETTGKILISRA